MTDHRECPEGSHHREITPESVTTHCAVDGGTRSWPRCPETTRRNTRCTNGVAEGHPTCWSHNDGNRAHLATVRENLLRLRQGRATQRATRG